MTLVGFIREISLNQLLVINVILICGVIFVNGWTDAPNAIATSIATRSLSPKAGIALSAVFNFLGVLVMTLINSKVALTIKNMVDFGDNSTYSLLALCAALLAIIVWAVTAWWFGIPTSESHALIAGLSGASIAINGGFKGINSGEWLKVIYGLILSVVLGFAFGFIVAKTTKTMFRHCDRRKSDDFFGKAQIFSAGAMSFMHGAQDGQKFIGILLLCVFMNKGEQISNFLVPIWMIILCSVLMSLGTMLGGGKIIKSVGMDMVKLKKHEGFSADLAGAVCLLFASLTGVPVSTTHTKTTAIMGVGAGDRISKINLSVVKNMILAWILTFPICGAIAFAFVKIILF